ncbi:hypothetical protein ACFSX9_01230 [Flavobacterium ardleyense]|uniref:Haem-binding uptake Tiki superfamily ChaN domain-containing protein n=1 Tax=Flavobacterium ardleyense TaxID=2038737 RepID=A0ABW5Z3Q1_9FLAO
MNNLRSIILLTLIASCNFIYAQINDAFIYKYNYNGEKLTTAYSKSKGILYKANNEITFAKSANWYKNKNDKDYAFSESIKTVDGSIAIDLSIVNKHFISDKFYLKNNIKQFKAEFGGITFEKNYIVSYSSKNKKYKITEIFYEIKTDKYVRLVITSNKILNENYITDKKLFIGFTNFIEEFKERPGKVINVLDVYFEKDYRAQIDLIKRIDLQYYNTNSLYGSVLVDLHTNEGSFDKIIQSINKRRKIKISASKTQNLSQKINIIADTNDVVMFNEFHVFPHTRFNFMYILKDLKRKGYDYLALETLPPPNTAEDIFINNEKLSGYYLAEPNCSLMINYAMSLGFKLVAYEEADQCKEIKEMIPSATCRDSIQALNIAKIYELDKNAKIVVFGGHAHIEKKSRDDWKFMRVALQELFPNKKMFSIGQTKYIRTNLDSIDINIEIPVYYDEDDGQFDGQIISPHYKKYYEWYYERSELMNHEITIDSNKEFFSLEIIPIQNSQEIYLPIFKCRKEDLQSNKIYIPSTIEYKIIYKDINNKRVK